MGAQRKNKNYPWDRNGYAKDPTKMPHQDGWCESLQVFKQYWNKFPTTPCILTVRSFNKIKGSITIEIKTPSWKGTCGIEWNRFYFHNANLADFFPDQIIKLLEQEEASTGRISAPFLIKIGDIIATAIKRDLRIVHQEGGNQEDADFTEYGPFVPGEFAEFKFQPKTNWGFVFLSDDC